MAELRFYLDENVPLAVAEQLALNGIDTTSAWETGTLGQSDENHLVRASQMERALYTHDPDFLRMAAAGQEHTGIIFARQYKATIGGWVRGLRSLHARMNAEEMVNQVIFLSLE